MKKNALAALLLILYVFVITTDGDGMRIMTYYFDLTVDAAKTLLH